MSTISDANVGTQTFALTVVYSQAMDTSQNPTVAFPTAGEDPTALPATLSFHSGSWTNVTTYVATYDVADANLAMPSIDVQVSGGKDAGGTAPAASTKADNFSIDTVNPIVASITPNLTTIADANAGSQKFTLTVVYSEAMNTGQNPTITFPTSGEDPTALPATLTLDGATWTSSTVFVATYDVADQNVSMPNIDVSVSGATATSGNAQADYAVANVFSVNTQSPTVASVTPNLTTVSAANVGTQKFTLTVVYSGAMNTSVTPTISFPTSGEDPTALPATLTLDGVAWTSSTVFVATYDVADQNLTMPSIDVQVSGGQNAVGNCQAASTTADLFSVNTLSPAVVSVTPNLTTIADANAGSQTFTLTVVYSGAMNTSASPTISFPTSGKDPTASPATLTLSSGNWTSGTTFVATYNVADQNVAIAAVDVLVAGRRTGRACADRVHGRRQFRHRHAEPDGPGPRAQPDHDHRRQRGEPDLHVDRDLQPGDERVGEPDDQLPDLGRDSHGLARHAVVQLRELDHERDLRRHVQRDRPEPVDVQHRRAGFGAQDTSGNAMASLTGPDLFSINMQSAAVASITPNLTTIAAANAGTGTFTLTVVFNQAMTTTQNPTIAFPTAGEDPTASPATLTFASGSWTNSTTFVATYNVVNQSLSMQSIDVQVSARRTRPAMRSRPRPPRTCSASAWSRPSSGARRRFPDTSTSTSTPPVRMPAARPFRTSR